jgi:hypothetical protein
LVNSHSLSLLKAIVPKTKLQIKKYIVFRDRDFDKKPTDNVELVKLGSMLLTHRACVENYLLNPDFLKCGIWVIYFSLLTYISQLRQLIQIFCGLNIDGV